MRLRLFFAITIIACAPLARASDVAPGGLATLKQPSVFALVRHARAPGVGDPPNFKLEDCRTQRNLSAPGRLQAKQLGQRLRAELGSDLRVYTSAWCRARDTAKEISPRYEAAAALNSFFGQAQGEARFLRDFRIWLAKQPLNGPPLILITHQVNITALFDFIPEEGEIVIAKRSAEGKVTLISRMKDWRTSVHPRSGFTISRFTATFTP